MKKRISIKIANHLKDEYLPVVKELIELNDLLWVDTVDCDNGIVYRIDFAEIEQKQTFITHLNDRSMNSLLLK